MGGMVSGDVSWELSRATANHVSHNRPVDGKGPGEAAAVMSFVELKQMARSLLPRDSLLRSIILSERDCLPRAEGLAKLELLARILGKELGG